jgi:hypothetical protein
MTKYKFLKKENSMQDFFVVTVNYTRMCYNKHKILVSESIDLNCYIICDFYIYIFNFKFHL